MPGALGGGNIQLHFNAAGLKWTTLTNLYLPSPDSRACTACGLVWLALPPEDLGEKLRTSGTPATQAWFASKEDIPLPVT